MLLILIDSKDILFTFSAYFYDHVHFYASQNICDRRCRSLSSYQRINILYSDAGAQNKVGRFWVHKLHRNKR